MNWSEHRGEGCLPRIGGMATMPSRAHTFPTALANILPQVDRLFLYFDKYESVPPSLANSEKIVPLLPAQHGELGADGKFLGVRLFGSPCLYFCFDDDIRYPPGYVELLASGLERHRFRAAVGLHATRFKPPHRSYRHDRIIHHFSLPLSSDYFADELGTGTLAFHTGRFSVDPRNWKYHTMADLLIALEAVRRGMARIAIRRPRGLVTPLEERQADSLYRQLQDDDSRETAVMRQALQDFPASWTPALNTLNG